MKRITLKALVASVCLALGSMAVQAGPVIIDGTDANDHGSTNGVTNSAGWEYMQRALENLASSVTPTASKTVTVLGLPAVANTQAQNAIESAFGLSSLVGAGWTINYVDGAAAIGVALAGLSTTTTGILYIPTAGLTSGDLAADELAAINAGAALIDNFVAGAGNPALGGGLFAMGETGIGAYGWLATLIPGIVVTDVGGGGVGTNITLTAAGAAAFPGLTNADLANADPWHNYFSGNLGGLSILGTALQGNNTRNVILGGGAGTVIGCGQPGQRPCPTPEPETLPLLAIGALAVLVAGWRRRYAR